ncbi:MAG: hypothetical protein AMXMBFR64_51210 [Myxococcales bacterium]
MSTNEPSASRLIATMAIAGLTSGLLLVGAYLGTLPTIQRNQAEALRAAVFRVVPGSATIDAWIWKGDRLVRYDGPKDALPEGEAVYACSAESGEVVGWAIPGAGPGFQDTIALIYGYDPARKVIVGMEVLESRETPGLGDKIQKDAHFVANFDALAVEPSIVAVKPNEKHNPNEVDTISGATISSKAVIRILNQSTGVWVERLAAHPAAEVAP